MYIELERLRAKYRSALIQLASLVLDTSEMGRKLCDQTEHACHELRKEIAMQEALDREALGKIVRGAWVLCCLERGDLTPEHLADWDQLDEPMREIDRCIGEAVARHVWGEIVKVGEGE